MTGVGVLFDVAGIEWKQGRFNAATLRCPSCRHWRPHLLIDGEGRFICLGCHRRQVAAQLDAAAAHISEERASEA